MTTPKKELISRQESIAVLSTESPVTAFGNDKDDDMYSVSEISFDKQDKQESKNKQRKHSQANFAPASLSKLPPELQRRPSITGSDEKTSQDELISNDTESTISDVSSIEDDVPSSFAVYAKTLFQCKTTHVYSCAALPQPLLEKTDKGDYLASLASWVTILRIMGDLPETTPETEIAIAGEEPTVVSKVKGYYKMKYTKKEVDDAQKRYSELFKDPMSCDLKGIPFLYDGKDTMLEKIQFVCALGIYRLDLRDELYCQLCKQLSNNPSKNSTIRGWVLMQLFAGSFVPSEKFAACLRGFLKEGPRDLAHKVDRILRRSCCIGTRGFPPSWLEFQAAKNGKPILLPVTYMNGHRSLVQVDEATTVKELCSQLSQIHNIKDGDGFSIYVALYTKISCLGNGQLRIMDAISECEQHTRKLGMRESNSGWRLFFRKELFSPWHDPRTDIEGTNLIYQQIMRGITLGEYKCEKESVLVLLAAQKYFLKHSSTVDEQKLEEVLKSWLPADKQKDHSMQVWMEKVKVAIKNNFQEKIPDTDSLKIDIVRFAMDKWFLLYSRFYDASKYANATVTWNDVVVAVNSKGIHILDKTETIRTHVSFIEITCLSKWKYNLSILTVKGEKLQIISQHTEDMFYLLNSFFDGLRERSTYALVLQNTADYGSLDIELVKGDLVELDKRNTDTLAADVYNVRCSRTGKSGQLPRDIIYILPTTVEPTTTEMAMLASQLKKDLTHFISPDDSKQHTLAAFARFNFRPTNESAVSKLLSKASFKKEKTDAIWQYSREPLKKPLLKKSTIREDARIFAVRCFQAIQQYMGDAPIDESRTPIEIANNCIIEQAARNRYLREEIYCQVLKQLTKNPNKNSCDKGWQLMYFLCGAAIPSDELQQECIKFFSTNKHSMAKECLNRMKITKRKGCRLFPPHRLEYEAMKNSQFTSPVTIYLPDGSKETVAVASDTRMADIKRHIGIKLKLKSVNEFSVYITVLNGIHALQSQDFYYDCISNAEIFLLRQRPDTPLSRSGHCVVMLRKLWVNAVPGEDKYADMYFHYAQQMQNYIQGFEKCKDSLAIQLAALIYRAKFANNEAGFSSFEHVAPSLLPKYLLNANPAEQWAQHVAAEYKKSEGMSADDAKITFLKIMEKWPTYGAVFFEVRQRQSKSLPKDMTLAINANGVHLINKEAQTKIVTHDFNKVPNWAYDEKSFTLILTEGSETKHLLLETRLGHNIDDMIMSYISYMMNLQMREKSGFTGSVGESIC